MYEVESIGTATIVHIKDEIDIGSRTLLEKGLEQALTSNPEKLVVSLKQCTYCDSTGLSVLVALQRRIGRTLTVVLPETGMCRKLFTVSGVINFMHCVPTIEAALQSQTLTTRALEVPGTSASQP